jgi:hypothetical protein
MHPRSLYTKVEIVICVVIVLRAYVEDDSSTKLTVHQMTPVTRSANKGVIGVVEAAESRNVPKWNRRKSVLTTRHVRTPTCDDCVISLRHSNCCQSHSNPRTMQDTMPQIAVSRTTCAVMAMKISAKDNRRMADSVER